MTIRHIFTNNVADAAGVLTVWNGATTATVNATDIVRPSDWNSAHVLASTMLGNTAGQSTVSGTNIVLAGGANITLSANGSTVSIIGGAGAAGNTGYLSAGTTNASLGTVSLANSNGVTFGVDGQTVTATVRTNYAASDHSHGNPTLALTNLSGTTASNSAGLTLSLSAAAGGGLATHDSQYHSGNIIPAAVQDFGHFAYSLGTAAVPAASADRLVFHGFVERSNTRFGMVTPDGTVVTHAQDAFIIVRNTSGATIDAGSAVYVTGSTGQTANVAPAKADAAATMPAIGVTAESIANNGFGRVQIQGVLANIDTSAFSEGDRLFISAATAGALTATAPLFPNITQRIAVVLNAHATQGKLLVSVVGMQGERAIQAVSAGTTSFTSGQAVFANSNGVSFGVDGNTVTATVATNYAASNHSHGNPTLALTNLSGTTASNSAGFTLSLSAGAGGAGDGVNILAAGTQTANTTGSVLFNDANGITFGMNNSSVITASHNGLTSQSNQAVSAANGSYAFQTLSFSNANGFSFGTSAGSAITGSYTVPTQTNQTAGIYAVGNTTGQSSSSTYDARTLSVDGAGIVSAGWSNGTLQISATQSNQAFSADASSTFQTLSLQNSNGISFSNNAGAVRLTHDLQYTSATSAITSAALHTSVGGRIYVTAQSTGQSSSSSYDLRTLSIVPDGIISAGWSNGSFRISATQSNQAFSAGAASSTFETLSFQDSNGLSFSNNAGAIRVSYTRNVASNAIQAVGSATGSGTNTSRFAADDHVHAGVFSVGVSTGGNTAGDTRVDVGRFVLAGGANITLSQATAANGLNTISVVGATAAAAPVNFSAGTTSNNLGTVVFSNSNGVSFGLNGSTITASVNAGAGGFGSIGISTQGNTSGTTGFASASMQLVGSNNITLSQSTSNNGAYTLTISGPSRPRINIYAPLGVGAEGTGTAAISWIGYSNGTLHVQPLHPPSGVFPGDMTVDRLGLLWSASHGNSTATTQAITSTVAIGIYTMVNATQLSRAYSGTMNFNVPAGNSNSSLFNGLRWITINSNQWDTQPQLSNTMYWIASFALSAGTSFTGQGAMGVRAGHTGVVSGFLGAASGSAVSNPVHYPFRGYQSVSTNALPAAIAASDMVNSGSAIGQAHFHYVLEGSAARSVMGIW